MAKKKTTTKKSRTIRASSKPASTRASAKTTKKAAPARRAKVTRAPKPAAKPRARAASKPDVSAAPVPALRRSPDQQERARAFAIQAARAVEDEKCHEIVLIDVRGKSPMSDFLVIGSGTSDRQMRSALKHVADLGEQHNYPVSRTASDERGTWLLADFLNVVVHLFEPSARSHYDLEMMWGDAPRIEWQRTEKPSGGRRTRASVATGEAVDHEGDAGDGRR
jgi:ribosome-associated protein